MFNKNLNKKLLVCIVALGIANAVSAELISPIPQIYIDVPSPGGKNFEKKALSLITPRDLQNCASYLESIQQQLTDFLSRIKTPSSPLQINVVPHSSKITMMDQKENEKSDAIYDEDSTSDEIKQLKSYLQIPESKVISLKDLRKRKARFDVFSCQMLVENVTETTKDFILNSIKCYLQVLQDSPEDFKQSQFLYVLMRLLDEHPTLIDIECKSMLQSVSKSLPVLFEENYHNFAIKIYEWLKKNDEGILGEYHI